MLETTQQTEIHLQGDPRYVTGRYRVWVQLRIRDSVRTAGFEVGVSP